MGIGAVGAEREKVSLVTSDVAALRSPEITLPDETVERVRVAVGRWAQRVRRDLPWRATRDPWAILVSETMLQQTQAARVVPKYESFLTRFPTVAACAAVGVGEVVNAWAGLGYNRRACSCTDSR
jgi:A/G-specific adenine glycosylase